MINLSNHSENAHRQKAYDSPPKPRIDDRYPSSHQKSVAAAAPTAPAIDSRIFAESNAVPTEWQAESKPVASSYSQINSASTKVAISALSFSARPNAALAAGDPAQNEKAVHDSYGSLVFARIRAAQKYERVLARDSIAGTVTMSFTINRRGRLRAERIAASSGNALLDRVAMRHLAAADPFPRPPNRRARSFIIPLTYRQSE
ncbi:energy transducer TonB [Parasphingorhabdus sp.]|uniref:energy transducer TonB n=1 Tax=Parasphingorhabdus sp. TaxID=2709688 RepID=UPI003A8C9839